MKSGGPLKHVILAFVLAAVCYGIFYFGIEHRRNQKGPWQVVFTNTVTATPMIIVDQSSEGVTNVQIAFTGEHLPSTHPTAADSSPYSGNSPVKRFAEPYPVPFDVPFGKCLFMDTTFLPGTITFELFGHEIELLPRVLVIDYQEHPWRSQMTIIVPAAKPVSAAPKT